MIINREQLKDAANYLIHARDYAAIRREIEDIVAGWDKRRVYFGGPGAILNPLISVGVQAPHKLKQLWGIINAKRMELPRFKRNEYQRSYMLAHRFRLALARRIEEACEGRPLKPDEWRKRKAALHAAWMKQRAAFIKAKGAVSWAERNEAASEFWLDIEAHLRGALDAMTDEPKQKNAQVRDSRAVRHLRAVPRTHNRVQTGP